MLNSIQLKFHWMATLVISYIYKKPLAKNVLRVVVWVQNTFFTINIQFIAKNLKREKLFIKVYKMKRREKFHHCWWEKLNIAIDSWFVSILLVRVVFLLVPKYIALYFSYHKCIVKLFFSDTYFSTHSEIYSSDMLDMLHTIDKRNTYKSLVLESCVRCVPNKGEKSWLSVFILQDSQQ